MSDSKKKEQKTEATAKRARTPKEPLIAGGELYSAYVDFAKSKKAKPCSRASWNAYVSSTLPAKKIRRKDGSPGRKDVWAMTKSSLLAYLEESGFPKGRVKAATKTVKKAKPAATRKKAIKVHLGMKAVQSEIRSAAIGSLAEMSDRVRLTDIVKLTDALNRKHGLGINLDEIAKAASSK